MDVKDLSRIFFTTSFGRKIKCIPEFRDMFSIQCASDVTEYKDHLSQAARLKNKIYNFLFPMNEDIYNVARTFYTYNLLNDFIKRNDSIKLPADKHLDIGAGSGLHVRYFLGQGNSQSSIAIDNRMARLELSHKISVVLKELEKRKRSAEDRSLYNGAYAFIKGAVTSFLFPSLAKVYRREIDGLNISKFIDDVIRQKQIMSGVLGSLYRGWSVVFDPEVKNLILERERMFLPLGRESMDYDFSFSDEYENEEYLVKDIYEVEGQFNLITSFFALEYFDLEKIFQKINDLLASGGTFVFLTNHWWYTSNGTHIIGNFPYACQRLSFDDLSRYFKENHSEESGEMEEAYSYSLGTQRCVRDFEAAAEKSGLKLLAFERVAPVDLFNHKLGHRMLSPELACLMDGSSLNEVLEDIKKFNGGVELDDLKSSHILMAFGKE